MGTLLFSNWFDHAPSSRLAWMAIVWHSKRIHQEISLNRKRICANRSGSRRIEFRSHSLGSAADPSLFFPRGHNSSQRRATSVSSQVATTSGRERRVR
jgi:hypothetical protein